MTEGEEWGADRNLISRPRGGGKEERGLEGGGGRGEWEGRDWSGEETRKMGDRALGK